MSKKAKLAKSSDMSTNLGQFTRNIKKSFGNAGSLKPELERLLNAQHDIEEEEEIDEATGASSAGSYETPSFWAKSKSSKDWRGASKTQYPGGKFVKIKEKCRHFPYCNQGDINALELWDSVLEKKVVKETIEKVSKKTGKPKERIRELIQKELDEVIRRSFYKSPATSLVGNFKMDKPIGKIYSMAPKGMSKKYE
jgi:hypothetical protein